jgi:hypothetical protein
VIEEAKPRDWARKESGSSVPEGAFPDEPFACPACGQMLAASCRICVACKQPVDPARIGRPQAEPEATTPEVALPALEPVRFPWLLFLFLLALRMGVAVVAVRHWGLMKTEMAFALGEFVSAVWVFQDAQRRGVPKPLRWGLGSLLLWFLFFPWYLARRRAPGARCSLVEAELGRVTRALLFALVVFLLLSVVLVIFKGPPPR